MSKPRNTENAISKRKQQVSDWKNGKILGRMNDKQLRVKMFVREYLFEKYNSSCGRCGWKEINPVSKQCPLQVEHIDGNAMNDREENLILLCPNCHSLTPTYMALNKGKCTRDRYK